MKTIVPTVLTVTFLVLNLLALDDITTGHEPDLVAEYATLAASLVWFAVVAAWWSRKVEEGSP